MGDHYLLNLYGCDSSKLDDESFLKDMIGQAITEGNLTLLNMIAHKFEPQGVTIVALLAESHISIHTWPENGTAAVDVYTCGDKADPEATCEYIRKQLNTTRYTSQNVKRD